MGQRLLEVTGLVQQTDAHHGNPHVGSGLEVVAGQDAQTARVLGKHRGDAVLGGEIGDGGGCVVCLGALIPLGLGQVTGQIGIEYFDLLDGLGIFGDLLDFFTGQGTQKFHGVTVDVFPGTRVELRKQIFSGLVP